MARLAGTSSVVSAVSGFGSLFSGRNFVAILYKFLLYPLYLWSFGHSNQRVIVQNEADATFLVGWRVLDSRKVRLIKGSGVDCAQFRCSGEPHGIPTVCFAARLLKDKGVFDYVAAARILRERRIHVRFLLAGSLDSENPSGLTSIELDSIRDTGLVEVLGHQSNIPLLYQQSHIVCLPSFYGEGIPKCLLEAAAACRAIVTTDHPGCRDAIIPNVSGLLVPVRDPLKLADALQWLIENPKERAEMGRAGRQLAERIFSIERVVEQHLEIYSDLAVRCR